jgi:protein TonB
MPARSITIVELESPPPLDEPRIAPTPVQPSAPASDPSDALPEPVPDAIAPDLPVSQPPSSGGTTGDPGESVPGSGGVPGDSGAAEHLPVWGTYEPVEELPVLVSSPRAEYSDLARDAGIEGRVVVRILVGKDGRVKDAVVDPKFSIPILDAIALEAARGSVFTPALNNGHPVAVWVARPYEFRLH